MGYPRFNAPAPVPNPAPPPAPVPVPDPVDVPTFDALLSRGVATVVAFHNAHPGHYQRIRDAHFSQTGTPSRRPLISR